MLKKCRHLKQMQNCRLTVTTEDTNNKINTCRYMGEQQTGMGS